MHFRQVKKQGEKYEAWNEPGIWGKFTFNIVVVEVLAGIDDRVLHMKKKKKSKIVPKFWVCRIRRGFG